METILAGFDPGNSVTSLAFRAGGRIVYGSMPSFVGAGDLRELLKYRTAAQQEGLDDDEYAIEFGGVSSFVGRLAREQSATATTEARSLARYSNGHSLRLLLGLAGRFFKEPVTLRLVTGLPIRLWSEEAKRAVQRALCGTHSFLWRGKPREVTIDAVGVLMEGAAVLYDVAAEDVPQVVADAGGGTLDLYWAIGRRPLYERCASFDDCGIDLVGGLVRSRARNLPYGRTLTESEITAVMHAHAHHQPSPSIYNQGHALCFDGIVGAAVSEVAALQIARVHATWDDQDKRPAAAARYARLVGGGGYFLRDDYRAIIPHIQVPRDPERANVLAFRAVAEAATEAQWARNRG